MQSTYSSAFLCLASPASSARKKIKALERQKARLPGLFLFSSQATQAGSAFHCLAPPATLEKDKSPEKSAFRVFSFSSQATQPVRFSYLELTFSIIILFPVLIVNSNRSFLFSP